MKKLIIVLFVLASVAAYADFLLIEQTALEWYMNRLDVVKGDSPYTEHYTQPRYSWMATVTTCILPIDERAQSVLTPEEWASRLATMPVDFVRPLPTP